MASTYSFRMGATRSGRARSTFSTDRGSRGRDAVPSASVRAFEPTTLRGLSLRNRVIKSATYEGMSPGGIPGDGLIEHHRALAAGGVGLTTVAYCAVAETGRTFGGQLQLHEPAHAGLRRLTGAVHAEGGAASLQLSHAGYFTKLHGQGGPRTASRAINLYGIASGLPLARAMTEPEIHAVIDAFGTAAERAMMLGFDAVEVHMGHGYLLSQFLSPALNRRRDAWGGDTERRAAFPLAVVARVREVVGDAFPIIVKTNLRDGFRGGLELEESLRIARMLEGAGVDLLVPSGGWVSKSPFYLLRGDRPLQTMIRAEKNALQRVALRVLGRAIIDEIPFEPRFFQELTDEVRAAVSMPVALLGGVTGLDDIEAAMQAGYDFVVMGRALIADPDLIGRMQRGEVRRSRCNACNECVGLMDLGGVRCALDE
jgi:2,4-dienoyl-CoA reductase-like NADH-dependent reductase (Old Yellow Enzyme family)